MGNLKQLKFGKNLFCIGDRYVNVIYSKMQMNCNHLREYLANSLHVIQSSTCDCGLSVENNSFSFRMQTIYSTQAINAQQVARFTNDYL